MLLLADLESEALPQVVRRDAAGIERTHDLQRFRQQSACRLVGFARLLLLNKAGEQFFVRCGQVAVFVQVADDVLGGLAQRSGNVE